MKPVTSNIKSNNKCLNPVTTKCVTWDGPDITCLDGTVLCKGQSIETTLYAIATKLCQVIEELNLEGINPCINNISDDTSVTITQDSTIQEVFSAIIQKVCSLTDRIITLEEQECPKLLIKVPTTSCLRADAEAHPQWQATCPPPYTVSNPPCELIEVTYFAEIVATKVCAMLIKITELNAAVANINEQINQLWLALQNCASNCNNLVLPTCTYNYTLNPDGEPVSVQTAYAWLESEYCALASAIGTSDNITEAVQKECPGIEFSDRLSAGGQMGDISGWISNPITLADSVNNIWLTVCDMRKAVSDILDGCCFSLCNYLEFGYDLVWDPAGNYVDIVFNGAGVPHLVYTSAAASPPASSPFNAQSGVLLSSIPWILPQFPTAFQTNLIITINDGIVSATFNTGQTLNDWAEEVNATSNGYRITFTSAPGYDKTSLNQTIQFSTTYRVVDVSTGTFKDCTIDQIDGLEYECCAPYPYPCNATVTETFDNTSGNWGMEIRIRGIVTDTAILVDSAVTAAGANTLTDTSVGNNFLTAGLTVNLAQGYGSLVYINYNTTTGTYDQCRRITNINSATQITVDSNFSPAITAADTYVIKDILYTDYQDSPCAFNSNPAPLGTTYLQNFTVKVIDKYPGGGAPPFDPNDESTWSVQYFGDNISWSVITSNPGFVVPTGYIDPNKEYAIAIFAEYTCGTSQVTLLNGDVGVTASVSVQFGTPTASAAAIFASSGSSVPIVNIIDNNVSLPPPANATPAQAALFPLTVPAVGNTTVFQVIPGTASWNNSPGLIPLNWCLCGIQYGSSAPGTELSRRESVLGLYRGYDVEVFYQDVINNTYLPILDQSAIPIPYKTNSLADPSLLFSSNTPQAGTALTDGIKCDGIQPTFTNSTYPIVVRYNPFPHRVNTTPGFHSVFLKTVRITIHNASSIPLDLAGVVAGNAHPLTFKFEADCKKWDPNLNSGAGGYANRTNPAYTNSYSFSITDPNVVFDSGSLVVGAFSSSSFLATPVGAPGSWPFSIADFGDYVFSYLIMNFDDWLTNYLPTVPATFGSLAHKGVTVSYRPVSGSQFSCSQPQLITSYTNINNYSAMPTGSGSVPGLGTAIIPWIGQNSAITYWDALLTEDYDAFVPAGNNELPGSINGNGLELRIIVS